MSYELLSNGRKYIIELIVVLQLTELAALATWDEQEREGSVHRNYKISAFSIRLMGFHTQHKENGVCVMIEVHWKPVSH